MESLNDSDFIRRNNDDMKNLMKSNENACGSIQ